MRLKQVSIFVHFVLYSISNFFSNILGCFSNLPSALFFSCDNDGDVLPLTRVHLPQPSLYFVTEQELREF